MKKLQVIQKRVARSLAVILGMTLLQIAATPTFSDSAHAYTQGTATNGTAYGGTGGNANGANQNCTNGAIVAIGTSKSGDNLNTFMFVCKTINSDASLSTTEATTNVFGTPAESDRCAAGQIAFGVRVIASNGGTLVGGVGLICGNPMSQGSQDTRAIMPNASSAGTVYTYTCSAGQLLAGFALRTGALVDQIIPKCSSFSGFVYGAVGAPTATVSGNTASVSFASVSGSIADTALTYTVTAVPNTGSTITVTGSSSPISVPGMVLRSYYTITVTASNTYGTSASTSSASATMALPGGETDTALGPGSANKNYASLNYAGTESVKPASSDAFTVEAWVQPTDTCTASNCGILGREENYLLTWEAGEIRFIVWNSTAWGTWQYTGVNLPLNQWSHVALTKSSSTWNLYVNGALVYTASLTYVPSSNTNYLFFIGNRSGGAYPFKGYIDEVKIWRATRSASEIATDMNRTITNDTNLYAYWNFNEGTGSTAYNQVPAASADTDLTMYATDLWNADSISTKTQSGAYTVTTFKRSILNLVGGWKSPSGISKVSILLVAGGGGGGGGLNGGGGGAGGFIETTTSITQSTYYQIYIGAGGVGSQTQTYAATAPSNGKNSTALSLTATGGGYGGSEYYSPNTHYAPASGGSGGGASWGGNSANYTGGSGTAGQGYKGGNNVSNCCYGAGGGGAGAVGDNTTSSGPGAGGAGTLSTITGTILAGGGGGSNRAPSNNVVGTGAAGGSGGGGAGSSSGTAKPNTAGGPQSGAANTGGGGGAGVIANGNSDGRGAQGGSGIVVVRWITALKPAFTAPTNAYLNVGMTETFTTNVAQDSATAVLTRTFRWESSTTGANGTYSLIKQGTGAANAVFSWIPTDTATSGSTFTYRVVVTDSDTAGLFIVDTSTPVWAVINKALVLSGNSNFGKAINVTRNETFTIQFGTPTFKPTLSPTIPGITLDTSTAGYAVIRIADTMTVGTYYETLTVIDSVSASVSTPLTITVVAPPNLVNTSSIVDSGIVFNLDFANSASFNRSTGAAGDLSGSQKSVTLNNNPTFSEENMGYLKMTSANSQYITATGFSTMSKWSIDTFFRLDSTSKYTCIVTGEGASSSATRNIGLCVDATTPRIYAGFHSGTYWTYVRTSEQIPLNSWTHVVAEWDGLTTAAETSIKIWINGVQATNYQWYTGATSATAASSNRVFINHDPVTSGASYTDLSVGYVRIYNRALSASEVSQNFNATKNRFQAANIDATYPSQKYGQTSQESYTAVDGYGTRTTTFAVGDRTGIDWDTTTVLNQVKLSIQESLSAGTYSDTVTVTDALGQSTYLPIKVTIAKADTITVTLRNPKTLTYTGLPTSSLPDISIIGLKNSDTGTVTRLYSAPASLPGSPETYTALVSSSVVPTDVESYTVTSSALTLSVGLLSNYESVTYESSSLIIVQAKQPAISVSPYGAYVGAPYTVVVIGGAGGGLISETVTAGSTASGCAVSNHVLTMTSIFQSYCNLEVAKAASRNYLRETATAQVYFFSLVINQPAPAPSSGPGVALSGATAITLDPNQAPTISLLSVSSGRVGDTVIITGAGFTASTLQSVKFWRNIVATVTGTTTNTQITVAVPTGATTGKILVTTANGLAITEGSFTVLP